MLPTRWPRWSKNGYRSSSPPVLGFLSGGASSKPFNLGQVISTFRQAQAEVGNHPATGWLGVRIEIAYNLRSRAERTE